MSVDIQEVLEYAGYNIEENLEDAEWLIANEDTFNELLYRAQELKDKYDEYTDFISIQEDELGNYDNPTFEEWVEDNKNA